jgi:hypothetical protein
VRSLWFALCLATLALGPAVAAADGACPGGRPWVALSFSGRFTRGFERSVSQDLTAGLAARGIRVCPRSSRATASAPPLADIRLSAEAETMVDVSVEVRDAVTQKRVGRDLDLARVPSDGRAFAVALAADELLQASWVELALERDKKKPVRAPLEVRTTVETALRKGRALPPPRFGARASGEHFGGGQTHFGADATFDAPITSWLRFAVAAGAREGRTVSSERGEISSSALGVDAGFELLLYSHPRFEGALALGARGSRVSFEGKAAAGAIDANYASFAVFARGGPEAALRLVGPFWLGLGAGLGAPVRAIEADDGEVTATGMSGLELSFAAGLSVEL